MVSSGYAGSRYDPHQYRPHQCDSQPFLGRSERKSPVWILYLSESVQVAQFEIGALAGDPLVVGGVLNAPGSFAAVHVKAVLQRVADLTVVSQQDLIETTAQELTGDWRGYQHRAAVRSSVQAPVGTPPTQDLGEAIFGMPGIEGFRALSAKLAYHRNLVVFPEKMFKKQ